MRRREGGREGEVIPRVWENTVAAEGMFGNLNPLGDGPGRSLADHGARVPEVLPAAGCPRRNLKASSPKIPAKIWGGCSALPRGHPAAGAGGQHGCVERAPE